MCIIRNFAKKSIRMRLQSSREEWFNTVTHAIGAILGLIALPFLVLASKENSILAIISFLIFGVSVILMFTASSVYHAIKDEDKKKLWRKIDHVSIFVLIAGTYTPITLLLLQSGSGWLIFGIVWSIAIFGAVLKLFFTGRYKAISLALYLIMGWIIVFDFKNLWNLTSKQGMFLIFLGGAFYTLGTLFYSIKKMPYQHVIWHVFVLLGCASHYAFMFVELTTL